MLPAASFLSKNSRFFRHFSAGGLSKPTEFIIRPAEEADVHQLAVMLNNVTNAPKTFPVYNSIEKVAESVRRSLQLNDGHHHYFVANEKEKKGVLLGAAEIVSEINAEEVVCLRENLVEVAAEKALEEKVFKKAGHTFAMEDGIVRSLAVASRVEEECLIKTSLLKAAATALKRNQNKRLIAAVAYEKQEDMRAFSKAGFQVISYEPDLAGYEFLVEKKLN